MILPATRIWIEWLINALFTISLRSFFRMIYRKNQQKFDILCNCWVNIAVSHLPARYFEISNKCQQFMHVSEASIYWYQNVMWIFPRTFFESGSFFFIYASELGLLSHRGESIYQHLTNYGTLEVIRKTMIYRSSNLGRFLCVMFTVIWRTVSLALGVPRLTSPAHNQGWSAHCVSVLIQLKVHAHSSKRWCHLVQISSPESI